MEIINYTVTKPFRSTHPEFPGHALFEAQGETTRVFILAAQSLKTGDIVPDEALTVIPGTTYFTYQAYALMPGRKV